MTKQENKLCKYITITMSPNSLTQSPRQKGGDGPQESEKLNGNDHKHKVGRILQLPSLESARTAYVCDCLFLVWLRLFRDFSCPQYTTAGVGRVVIYLAILKKYHQRWRQHRTVSPFGFALFFLSSKSPVPQHCWTCQYFHFRDFLCPWLYFFVFISFVPRCH